MIELAELTDQEEDIFETEFDKFLKNNYPSVVAVLLKEHKEFVIEAIKRVKGSTGRRFAGGFPNAGEFGWAFPQPQFFDVDTWELVYSQGRWYRVVDSPLKGNSMLLLFGFYNIGESRSSHAFMQIDGRTYPVQWLQQIKTLKIFELPLPIYITAHFTLDVKIIEQGKDELTPLGIYFGTYPEIFKQNEDGVK